MYAPIFEIATASAAVQATLGTGPTRLYGVGDVPEGVAQPYAVWKTVRGTPTNYLDGQPDIDQLTQRIRVYGATVDSVRQVAAALRDAIELHAHVTRWRGERRDAVTGEYRLGFDVQWHIER